MKPPKPNPSGGPAQIVEWLRAGLQAHQAGRLDEAGQWYAKVRRAAPRNFDGLQLDGTRALQQGQYAEAAAALAAARQIDPKSAICAMRLGMAQFQLTQFAESEASLRAAAKLDSKLAEVPFHLGRTLQRLGQREAAAAELQRAIALKPDYAEAYDQLGTLLSAWKGPDAAESVLLRATQLDPNLARAWCNLGVGWTVQGKLSDAIGALDQAIRLVPTFDHAYAARGIVYAKAYRSADAIADFDRAIALNPRHFEAHSARLMELQYVGQLGPAEMAAEHRKFGVAAEPAGPAPRGAVADRTPDRPLRVGFLSPDLHLHSVAFFLEPLLLHLDRAQFQVFLYSDSTKHDAMSERLKGLAQGWRPMAGMLNEAAEAILRRDELDVLVDLAGHTGKNRLPLYAKRLAPVQATYLGYPDTTGMRSFDYRLVDGVTDPEGADAFATEQLLRFAPTAWSYLPPPSAAEPACSPAAAGGAVTFGCFNNIAKMNDVTLALWGTLLRASAGSRLLLKGRGLSAPVLRDAFFRRLAAAGVPSDRVVLLDRISSLEEHLATYGQVDVALDTFPYHGTTTTCEALWMGVPVVTLAGHRHASRVGVSLLTAIGKSKWITSDAEGYVARALELGESARTSGPAPRSELRASMRRSALMDHAGQAARFGAALRSMWKNSVVG